MRVTASRVRHAYEFGRFAGKLGTIERNRRLMLRTNYRLSTRLLLCVLLMAWLLVRHRAASASGRYQHVVL